MDILPLFNLLKRAEMQKSTNFFFRVMRKIEEKILFFFPLFIIIVKLANT